MPSTQPTLDARPLVDTLLHDALLARASDLHVEPTARGHELRLRIDGLLHTQHALPPDAGRAVIARLMVMANLLTYRQDIPQEGRATVTIDAHTLHLRIAIMPTSLGLRAAVRMPAELHQPRDLTALGLPPDILAALDRFAHADSGMLLVTGPAGSGKTTTLYALLSHIAATSQGLSIITLEDPVERHLEGITQIEVTPFGQLTYARALKSILRQDPQVLMLGEIRDAETASLAVQAALSGHRLLSTLHAATPAGALARLLEMGLEPYQIASSVHGILSQRLLRRRHNNTYQGRIPVAQYLHMDPPVRQAVLNRHDIPTITAAANPQPTHRPLHQSAQSLLSQNLTDPAEIERVLGPEN